MPAAPLIADIVVNGKPIKAVAQATKQGLLYVFDRVTGQPVWPIEEKPVPQTDVPGEKTSPTQPIPTRPPAYSRNGVVESDLIDFTPELKAAGLEAAKRYRLGPVFLPPLVSKAEGPIAALTSGTLSGGVNWPGSAYDPEMHAFFTHACSACISPLGLVAPPKDFSDLDYVMGTAGATFRPITGGGEGEAADAPRPAPGRHLPAASTPPPAAAAAARRGRSSRGRRLRCDRAGPLHREAAVRPDRRDQSRQGRADVVDAAWRHAGQRPQSSGAQGLTIPKTGQSGNVGVVVTKTLVVAGDPQRDDDAGASARGDAARVRQADRQSGRRGLDAGAAERIADDVLGRRPAVHHRGRERRRYSGESSPSLPASADARARADE